jgi:hypothetical protein
MMKSRDRAHLRELNRQRALRFRTRRRIAEGRNPVAMTLIEVAALGRAARRANLAARNAAQTAAAQTPAEAGPECAPQ